MSELNVIVLFCSFLMVFAWERWGAHEASFNRIKNIARKSLISQEHYDINKNDQYSKRFSVFAHFFMIAVTAIVFAFITQDWKLPAAWLFFGAASRWFVFEIFYGYHMVHDFLHIGTGGKFDDEVTENRWTYFFIRLGVFTLATVLLFITL